MEFLTQQSVFLSKDKKIKECDIRDYIFSHPNVLGLGDLTPLSKEITQPSGGRIDMLFSDDDNNRYEVELQLGRTDESHIIRTIEYWDIERKRYTQYNHIAVIIAEEITSRFQNVISLFNNHIPLIAIQLSATQISEDKIALQFIRVMNSITPGTDEEITVPSDRKYWEQRHPKIKEKLPLIDQISDELFGQGNYSLNYTKQYIGMIAYDTRMSTVQFDPKVKTLDLRIIVEENPELTQRMSDFDGFDNYKNLNYYLFRFKNMKDFMDLKDDIKQLVQDAMRNKGITENL